MANEYKIWTIADIARIPEDALPRFLNELPAIVSAYKPVMLAAELLNGGKLTPQQEFEALGAGKWIDDDKETITHTVSVDGMQFKPIESRVSDWNK